MTSDLMCALIQGACACIQVFVYFKLRELAGSSALARKLGAANGRLTRALTKTLNAGNLAAQGKWDATDEMKDICYKALVREELE